MFRGEIKRLNPSTTLGSRAAFGSICVTARQHVRWTGRRIGHANESSSRYAGVCLRLLAIVLPPVLCLSLAACGGSGLTPGFARAEGTITLDGEPLQDAMVTFESERGTSYGRTDENGHYVAVRSRNTPGVDIGPTTVRISTRTVFEDLDRDQLTFDPEIGDYVREEIVPLKYNRESELEINVTESNGPYDFDLKRE